MHSHKYFLSEESIFYAGVYFSIDALSIIINMSHVSASFIFTYIHTYSYILTLYSHILTYTHTVLIYTHIYSHILTLYSHILTYTHTVLIHTHIYTHIHWIW